MEEGLAASRQGMVCFSWTMAHVEYAPDDGYPGDRYGCDRDKEVGT